MLMEMCIDFPERGEGIIGGKGKEKADDFTSCIQKLLEFSHYLLIC